MSSSVIDTVYRRMNDDTEIIPATNNPPSDIQNFYAGKTVFLTGATGFLGKLIVEKLLRSCPDIKKLYVLIRNKRGNKAEDILEKLFRDVVFDRLRKEVPNFSQKVGLINGDLSEPELGISQENREKLISEVNIMIHNGATVKFDEIVNVALKINVIATKCMLELASQCKNMNCFLYISTAYSHCYQKHIEEKFYRPPVDLKFIQEMIKTDTSTKNGLSGEALTSILGKWPNIYCFTKSMAEDLVRQHGLTTDFPCAVYRPSIVMGTLSEPFPGWTGNLNGPGYVFLGAGLGFVHAAFYKCYPMDFVPADYTVNALITATWDMVKQWNVERAPRVYNFGSSMANPIRLNTMQLSLESELESVGSKHMVYIPFVIYCQSKWTFMTLHILLHFLPALLLDLFLVVQGQKPKAASLCWKATTHLDKIDYFANGNWRIYVTESMKALKNLNATDRKLFDFDIKSLSWEQFVRLSVRGYRVYTLKEPLDNIEYAKKRFQKLKYIHYTICFVFFSIAAYYFYKIFNCIFGFTL